LQVPKKKHFPTVGLLGLVLVAAAGGSIFYYQFVLSPSASCGITPVHRIIFMRAIIHERGGFSVTNAAVLKQAALPSFSNSTGPDLGNVTYADYKTADNSTIQGNEGDTVTLYIKAISTNDTGAPPKQDVGATGHGFAIDASVNVLSGAVPNNNIAWGTWFTVTFQFPATAVSSTYHCTQFCSAEHPQMRGGLSVGCS
jgi:FtsP/CotA-like multicopper oxidase with cupredoxin domain